MGRVISCADAEALLAAHAVGSLDDQDLPALRKHLGACPPCRQMAGAYVTAASRLPLSLDPVEAPASLRNRLMAAVYSEAATKRNPADKSVSWLSRLWTGIPAARGWTIAGGLATAVAIVGLTGVVGQRHTASGSTMSVSVSGTTAQPLAHGKLAYDGDTHMAVLTVDGLAPQPDPDGASTPTYEVWLIGPGGTAEPAAYLTHQPKGSTWTAAITGDMSHFRALAVTLEPGSGRLAPSGNQVLQADLTPSQ